jgi:hypothetical protein
LVIGQETEVVRNRRGEMLEEEEDDVGDLQKSIGNTAMLFLSTTVLYPHVELFNAWGVIIQYHFFLLDAPPYF